MKNKPQSQTSGNSKSERVKVYIRVRPFNDDENKRGGETPFTNLDVDNGIVSIKKEYDVKNYTYDGLYDMNSTQDQIFENSAKPVIDSALKGYNGTIFAYGQTGSGKTFTMVGDFNNKSKSGIIPRSISYIYKEMNRILKEEGGNNSKFSLSLSFIQIYLESIQDLLDPDSKEIKLREDPDKGVYLEGVQWVRCSSPEECAEIFHMGERNRATESTRMNAHSSRSHAILIIRIERSIQVATKTKVKNIKQATDRIITCSHLYLVDLAGSERVKKTGATNMRLEEAKKINVSLLALGNVISALSDPKSTHISYRDSKLTRLLQESLGGNAKTSLIVTVSPSTYNTEETISSLFFALRAMKVQNKPKINKTVDYQALCQKLQEDLDKLNDEYAKLKIEYEKVVTELDKLKKGEKYLQIKQTVEMNEPELQNLNNMNNNNNDQSVLTNKSDKSAAPISNEKIQKMKADFKKKAKKLEEFYENLMKTKNEEYENILKKVDDIVYEKESQIDKLNSEIRELKTTIKSQKEDIEDLTKERDELQKSVVDFTTQVQEQKDLLNQSRTEKQYRALIDQLNSQIFDLEKRLINMEDSTVISDNFKEKISNELNIKISDLENEMNTLAQKKKDYTIKKSQNEIKLKLSKEEALKSKSLKEKLKNEIIESQKENFKLIMEEESTNKRIEIIENQINCAKNIINNLDNLVDEFREQNKIQLMMNLANKEIDNQIKEETIKNYENAFTKEERQEFESKFLLFKSEGEMNSIINKVLFLNNNYQSSLFKLDDINKELSTTINEPNNEEKLSKIKDNIQSLLEETQDINRVIKKEMHKDFSSASLDDNIPFERCTKHLDKLFSNVIYNLNTLIDSYNYTNSNVCTLLTNIYSGITGKNKILENLTNYVQENIGDLNTKKKLNDSLDALHKCNANYGQFFKEFDKFIKELCDRLVRDSGQTPIDFPKIDTHKYLDKIEELKRTIKNQGDTINETNRKMAELKKGVNQLNEFLKLNQKDGKLDVKKITKVFDGYNNQIDRLSIDLKSQIEKIRDINDDYNLKDLNTGKFLIGQYYATVAQFSNDLYNFGLKEDI